MSQFLLDSFQLLFHVPQPNTSVSRTSDELIVVCRMVSTVVHCSDVSFCLMEVLDVHVALYSEKSLRTILIGHHHLLTTADNKYMSACYVVGEISDSVSLDWLGHSETIHVLVHAMEVPHAHSVVKGAGYHTVAFWVHVNARHRLLVSFQDRERVHWNLEIEVVRLRHRLLIIVGF